MAGAASFQRERKRRHSAGVTGYRGFGPTAPLAAELASSFAVITYDRRGRGESTDTPPYAVDREVEDLQALVDVAGGSAFAYGFSSGAVLLLHAALAGVALPKLALLGASTRSPSGRRASPDSGTSRISPAGRCRRSRRA